MATASTKRGKLHQSKVCLGWIYARDVDGRFQDCVMRARDYMTIKHDEHVPYLAMRSSPRIAEARTNLTQAFLQSEALASCEWLLMLDSDMTFDEDVIERMLEVASVDEVPILGGLAFGGWLGWPGFKMFPTVYRETEDPVTGIGYTKEWDYPRDSLLKVGATGCACLLVHRNVFLAMARPHPNGFGTTVDGRTNPYPWYVEGWADMRGEPLGEDVAFCRKARLLGIPTHVHTGIKFGHSKMVELTEELYDFIAELNVARYG